MTNQQQPRGTQGRATLEALKERLGKLVPQQTAATQVTGREQAAQTVSDDLGELDDATAQLIARDEQLVRNVLRLFDVDYDGLIGTEGDAPYARAVQSQPQVLEAVRQAEFPVLAALKVALDFKPYAEFAAKYGTEPQHIREALKKELREELSTEREHKQNNTPPARASQTELPFAGSTTAAVRAAVKPKHRLEDIFKS